MEPQELGALIREARLHRELSMAEASREAGISSAQWAKLELGQVANPTTRTRREVRKVLEWDAWPNHAPSLPSPAPAAASGDQAIAELVKSQAEILRELRALRRALARLDRDVHEHDGNTPR